MLKESGAGILVGGEPYRMVPHYSRDRLVEFKGAVPFTASGSEILSLIKAEPSPVILRVLHEALGCQGHDLEPKKGPRGKQA